MQPERPEYREIPGTRHIGFPSWADRLATHEKVRRYTERGIDLRIFEPYEEGQYSLALVKPLRRMVELQTILINQQKKDGAPRQK